MPKFGPGAHGPGAKGATLAEGKGCRRHPQVRAGSRSILENLEKDGGTMDTEWMNRGKCKDLSPSIFFPSDGVGVQAAQRICAECPV
ncbi:MAG TPA: WhiB family transcriptional regulator, partial [Acidimicrobiales bacterium]|nr:WhiB family transcriptional regulator [Acidimicrobiales bacterium]